MKKLFLRLIPILIISLLMLSSTPIPALAAQSPSNESGKPDLVVESLTWTPDNPSCKQDLYAMKFKVRIKNAGSADAASFMLKLTLSGSNMSTGWGLGINGLASETEKDIVFPPSFSSGRFPLSGGTYDVRAIVDSEGEVKEAPP